MRVVEVVELAGPDAVRLGERPEPTPPADGGILVAVKAVGLSFPDLLRTRGQYQDKVAPPYVIGQEFAGEVVSASADSGYAPGDRVAGMTGGTGAAAERLYADPALLAKLPESLSYEQGAAALFNYQTAVVAMEIRGRIRPGETVLAHGAAGGTGTAVIQVAKANDATVIAVVSSDEKAAAAREAGADHVVRSDGPWKDQATELTGGRGADIVFDPVGGDRMLDTIRALAYGGRWVIIGFTGGSIPQVPANRLLLKNVELVGSYLGGFVKQVPNGRAQVMARVRELLAAGAINPVVGATFRMDQGTAALTEMSERRARGKVVLAIG
jgi:NADPH:quinone reductase